jgi:hypothetical protein
MTIPTWLRLLGAILLVLEMLCAFYPSPFLDNPKSRMRWILGLWATGTFFLFSHVWYPWLFG